MATVSFLRIQPAWQSPSRPAESGSMVAKLTELLSAAGEIETGDFLAAPPHLASHCPTDYSLDQVVGPYRLEALLGRGGMAEVWRASRIDGHLRREVALKLPFLPPQAPRNWRR